MASGVFGLKKVYKRQVENINNGNFASWPESATYGYFGGGIIGIFATSYIQRLDFLTDTTSTPEANLTITRRSMGAVATNYYGYFGGGFASATFYSKIDRIDFSAETVSAPGNNLPSATAYLATVSSSSYGYLGGGQRPPGPISICAIDRLDFSTETVTTPTPTLSQARDSLAAVSSSSYGYFVGGGDPTPVRFSKIDRIDFSTEIVSVSTSNLPQQRGSLAATPSSNYGYFGGGNIPPLPTPVTVSTIDRLDFSTEIVTTLISDLSIAKHSLAATSSSSYGYFGGGTAPAVTYVSNIDRLDFSTEIKSALSSNLNNDVTEIVALSGGQSTLRGKGVKTYGYTLGGKNAPGPSRRNEVERMDFSTDTSTSTTPLPRTDERTAGAAGRNFGYVVNGESGGIGQAGQIYRMDFSNETQVELPQRLTYTAWDNAATSSHSYVYSIGGSAKSSISRIDIDTEVTQAVTPLPGLPAGTSGSAAMSSNLYGYVGGGAIPTDTSNIWRIDFSNETINEPGAKTLVAKNFMLSYANPFYGYFSGGSPIVSNVSRLDFSNDTVSDPGKFLPTARGNAQGYSSSSYGYVGGGNIPGDTATIIKHDYSTDQVSLLSATLPFARNWVAGYSNSN